MRSTYVHRADLVEAVRWHPGSDCWKDLCDWLHGLGVEGVGLHGSGCADHPFVVSWASQRDAQEAPVYEGEWLVCDVERDFEAYSDSEFRRFFVKVED